MYVCLKVALFWENAGLFIAVSDFGASEKNEIKRFPCVVPCFTLGFVRVQQKHIYRKFKNSSSLGTHLGIGMIIPFNLVPPKSVVNVCFSERL